jgi:N-methylhydantoinase B/oxoprolinase/acetone carboxylase alpha subunit
MQDTVFSSHGDRQKNPPWGLQGGKNGAAGKFVIDPDTLKEYVLPSAKVSELELRQGNILSSQTPGSGGFGNPLKRRPEYVLEDVLNEKVSLQNAKELYGVVIDMEKHVVDKEATEALRNRKASFKSVYMP